MTALMDSPLASLHEEGADERRVGICPECGVAPLWLNQEEFVLHALACVLIGRYVPSKGKP